MSQGLVFPFSTCFFISVPGLNIKLQSMCAGNAVGCDQNSLMALITEHPLGSTSQDGRNPDELLFRELF